MSARVGTGFDAHRLVAGRPLVLGGVTIAHPRGLAGHSDGDCLLHAVCDAILGALGLGDMGRHFPSRDGRWKDAASITFLHRVAELMRGAGFALGNLDATLIAQAPALGPHLDAMRAQIAEALGAPLDAVSVKAKTTDGLGALGREEGIAAQAAVLLERCR
ncbi:MAG TPA: 2-C-methyl-D-erythritol 2,4-cyclodiphosphate synthase [Vicinamibacteria bacterium]|nr:2-C-methyl-D-erythritol 2,4-cyclodiphosphate synthase [Vicinamibacteria bacterium]